MTRVKNTPVTHRRRKKILKQAKGYFGSKRKLFKTAKEQLMHSLVYSYHHRKKRAGDFRSLAILRINNICREKYGMSYSQFIHLANLSQILLTRKAFSEIGIHHPEYFDNIFKIIQETKELKNKLDSSKDKKTDSLAA